jgi:putative addiction module killer protein
MKDEIYIQIYKNTQGKCPYLQWESKLNSTTRAIVSTRLIRIRLGNFGDCKSIQGMHGLFEIRIHFGPGYRIYFGKYRENIILLLSAGDKKSQKNDIQKSYQFWKDFLKYKKGEL